MVSRIERNKEKRKTIEKIEVRNKTKTWMIRLAKVLGVLLVITGGCYYYLKYVATYQITLREYALTYENLPSSFHGFKIAHFGDLYYNQNTINLSYVVKSINKTKPDIVVFTGGLIHSSAGNIEKSKLISVLEKIDAPIGKFYVLASTDNEECVEILNQSGFTFLDQTSKKIYYNDSYPITIEGIMEQKKIEKNEDDSSFTISLVHLPDWTDEILSMQHTDLILSGNSLNGQIIIPYFGPLIKFEGSRKYYEPYYKINDTDLYITGGIGTNNFPVRLFNHPSINLYRLMQK